MALKLLFRLSTNLAHEISSRFSGEIFSKFQTFMSLYSSLNTHSAYHRWIHQTSIVNKHRSWNIIMILFTKFLVNKKILFCEFYSFYSPAKAATYAYAIMEISVHQHIIPGGFTEFQQISRISRNILKFHRIFRSCRHTVINSRLESPRW